MGFDLVFARGGFDRCGSFGCSTNDSIRRKHHGKHKYSRRHDRFDCDSSYSRSSSSSSSSDCHIKKLDCDFGKYSDISNSSDGIIRRRRHRKRRCDSSSSYSSCSSSSSSSCSSSSSSSSCPTPVPNRCTALFESALKVLDNALLTYLKNFELQYRQQIVSFLTSATAAVSAFNPQYTGSDYPALITAINAEQPPDAQVPASAATELQNIEAATIASIVKAIQGTINGVLKDLLARVQTMCLSELIDLVNSGLLTSQITSAFTLAANDIAAPISAMVSAQLAALQKYNLTPAATAIATTQLNTNGTNLATFLNTELTALQTQVNTLLTNLIVSLGTLITDGVKAFQNLAIAQINALVNRIFGTVDVPPPIPPVV